MDGYEELEDYFLLRDDAYTQSVAGKSRLVDHFKHHFDHVEERHHPVTCATPLPVGWGYRECLPARVASSNLEWPRR